jgi:hypothetical protein
LPEYATEVVDIATRGKPEKKHYFAPIATECGVGFEEMTDVLLQHLKVVVASKNLTRNSCSREDVKYRVNVYMGDVGQQLHWSISKISRKQEVGCRK